MRLVQAVLQPARDQVPVAARQPEHQQRACATLKTASAIGTSAGSAARASLVADGLVRARRAPPPARPGRRSALTSPSAQTTNPP